MSPDHAKIEEALDQETRVLKMRWIRDNAPKIVTPHSQDVAEIAHRLLTSVAINFVESYEIDQPEEIQHLAHACVANAIERRRQLTAAVDLLNRKKTALDVAECLERR